MEFYALTAKQTAEALSSDLKCGLLSSNVEKNRAKYGKNEIKKKKRKGFFARLVSALSEPTLL
ncbi:MAG: hypothetical protein J5836_01355, partial [Clostridia bacterium]|nr:hypothetical protein [Clostridia bacterium]